MPPTVFSMEAACVDNAILLDYVTSELVLEEADIGSTDPKSRKTTIAQMPKWISGCQWAVGIMKMKGTKATSAKPAWLQANDDGPWLILRGEARESVMSTDIRARMMILLMLMKRKKRRKPIMDQCRMWRTESIEALTWEPVMSTGMRVRMATMPLWMRRKKHHKLMMDQRRIWETESIVLESMMIGQYIADK
jgi:hypothetical protein